MADVLLTDEFLLDALLATDHGGMDHLKCACGKTHFNASCDDREDLRIQMSNFPELFVEHDCPLSRIYLGEKQIVIGCDCGQAVILARAILCQSRRVAEFLSLCADRITATAVGAKETAEIARSAAKKIEGS